MRLILLITSFAFGSAFPDRAGGCVGLAPAVGGSHVNTGKTSNAGFFPQFGITVTLGDIEMVSRDEFATFPSGVDTTLTVSSPVPFRGILIRLARADGESAMGNLIPDETLQPATVCEDPVAGITHRNNTDRMSTTATIRFDEPNTSALMDITVVFFNNSTDTSFSYDSYGITATESQIASASPTMRPTMSPVTPTPQPVSVEPTTSPVAPTIAPTRSPEDKPAPDEDSSPKKKSPTKKSSKPRSKTSKSSSKKSMGKSKKSKKSSSSSKKGMKSMGGKKSMKSMGGKKSMKSMGKGGKSSH